MRAGAAAIALSLLLTVSHGIRTPVGAQQVAGVPEVRDAVAEIFATYDRTDSPGCALGVIRAGETLLSGGFDMARRCLRPVANGSCVRKGGWSRNLPANGGAPLPVPSHPHALTVPPEAHGRESGGVHSGTRMAFASLVMRNRSCLNGA
jgi:hypothetical protein